MTQFQEGVGNPGYLMLAPETQKGVAVATTDCVPLYEETLTTNPNLQDQAPIFGNKFEVYKVLAGMRDHDGDLTVLCEANTALKWQDMLLTRGTPTCAYTFTVSSANATLGATYTNNGVTFTVVATIAASTTLLMTSSGAPQTSGTLTKGSGTGDSTITFSAAVNTTVFWPLGLSTTNPKSYTIDISYVDIVVRYWGVEASKIVPNLNNNETQLKVSVTGLGSFAGRQIASVSGSGPYTITFTTDYDPNPSKGLVVGDLIRVFKVGGGTIDATVASVVNGTQITTSTNVSAAAAGDVLFLRPATIALNLLPTFLASDTEWCFADTAADAMSATFTPVELASTWELDHNMNNDKGESRYGSRDPASIIRTTGNYAVSVKKTFRGDEDLPLLQKLQTTALVIRMLAYQSGNTYELRLIFNSLTTDDPLPQLKPKEVKYSTIKYHPSYNVPDSQGMSVVVINKLVTIS